MKKNNYLLHSLWLLFTLIVVSSCASERDALLSPIQLGKSSDLDKISLSRRTTQNIILTGGSGHYTANIEDPAIALATIVKDTLKIEGMREGKTFVHLLSQDLKRIVPVEVINLPLLFTTNEITLAPKKMQKTVHLSGGGRGVTIDKIDKYNILDVKWDGNTGLLEIMPKIEGVARIVARTADGKIEDELLVRVKSKEQVTNFGVYRTNETFKASSLLNNQVTVTRPNVGTWLLHGARPYTGCTSGGNWGVCQVPPKTIHVGVLPTGLKVGDSVTLQVSYTTPGQVYFTDAQSKLSIPLSEGSLECEVDEILADGIIVRSQYFKFYLPYNNESSRKRE